MKVEVVDVTGVEKRVEIEVPVERVSDEIEEKYNEVQRTAQVKGFRPGKVPRKMLERLFKDYVYELTAKKLVEETLETALDRKGIKPVVDPVLDAAEVKEGEPFLYTVHVEVRPEIEVKDYRGLEVVHQEKTISDEDVDKVIEEFRESVALIQPPEQERPVKAGDLVIAKITAAENGEPVEFAGPGEQEIELWRPSWIPGLEERLIGAKPGDVVVFNADVPEGGEAPAKFRGKSLELSFAVSGLKERTLPALDDSLAKDNTRFETLAELRESVRKNMSESVAQGNRTRLQEAVAAALIAKNPIEVPPTLVEHESLRIAMSFMKRSTGRDPQPEEAARFKEMFKQEAMQVFQASYLLEAVAKAEGIEPGEEEIEARIKEEADRAGLHPDKLKARLDESGLAALKLQATLEKALDFLVSNARITGQPDAPAKDPDPGA